MTGRCLCAAVRYRVRGELSFMRYCHCSMCRKSHGTAFATYVNAPVSGFEWTSGRDLVTTYESSPGVHRRFCSLCGSVVPGWASAFGMLLVPAGTLEGDCGVRPVAHAFVASKAPWYRIADDLPRYDAAPPGFEAAAPAASTARAPSRHAVAGSCLCGRVAFDVIGEPFALVNCHCSRCRHGRGSAHASNLFVKPGQLRWRRGEDEIRVYDLPGAQRFGTNFCPTCGSCVPRLSTAAGRVNVPMGSLDSDWSRGPTMHIYVGSKAPWFEIADDLPRHEAAAG